MMRKNILVSAILGLLGAVFVMNAAWEHNSQGEIHVDGVINWSYWLLIGFSWFLPIFICSLLVGWLVVAVIGLFSIRKKKAEQGGVDNQLPGPSRNDAFDCNL